MNREEALNAMDDYLEGTLPEDVRIAFEAHLLTDPESQQELERLRALLREASALAGARAPRRDLWPGIEARIGRGLRRDGTASPAGSPDRWARLLRSGAVVAALVVIVIGSVLAARFLAKGPEEMTGFTAFLSEDSSGLGAWIEAEREYLQVISSLARPVEELRKRLPDIAREVILESLRVVDEAIASSRAAVEENPGDPGLHVLLSDAYRTKVELLEWTEQIISLN